LRKDNIAESTYGSGYLNYIAKIGLGWDILFCDTYTFGETFLLEVVFEGSVGATGKRPKPNRTATEKDRTVGCGCPVLRPVRLPVASLGINQKTDEKPVAIGCNRFFTLYIISYLSTKFLLKFIIVLSKKTTSINTKYLFLLCLRRVGQARRKSNHFVGAYIPPVAAHGPRVIFALRLRPKIMAPPKKM
jgi:hypothetical protein